MAPVPSIVQASGPASAGPADTSDSAPAPTVPRNAFRNRAPAGLPVVPLGQAQMFVMKIPNNPREIAVGSSSRQLFDQYLSAAKSRPLRHLCTRADALVVLG